MKTKLTSLLLSAALLNCASPVFADEKDAAPAAEEAYAPYAPKQYDLSRYEHMRKKSPFEFEAPQKEVEATVDPFEGVTLAGYAGSGKMMSVYLLIGKEKKRVTVWGDASPMKKSDDSGFRIVGLTKGKSLASSEVTLEKDGQQKGIKFEEDTLKNAKGGAGGGAAGQGGVQMMPDGKGGMVARPVIPRPTGAPANMGNTGFAPPAPFIPGQTPAPANGNPGNNNPGNGNPLNVQPAAQQGINNLTVPNVPQLNVPTTPPQGGDGRSGNGSGRRRVVLPSTQP